LAAETRATARGDQDLAAVLQQYIDALELGALDIDALDIGALGK